MNSFGAVGPQADRIIGTQTAEHVYGPLVELCALGGAVLLVGVGYTSMTLLHLAESDAGRKLFRRWAKDESGDVTACSTGGCSDGFDRFEIALQPVDEYVGESRWRYLDATRARRAATLLIRERPDITHCGREDCERCTDALRGGPIVD